MKNIVSLVPSLTRLLYDLNCEDHLLGITDYCPLPKKTQYAPKRIGGPKTPDLKAIRELAPDCITANTEENRKEDILDLKKDFPVYVSDVNNLSDSLTMIRKIGLITDRENEAGLICRKTVSAFNRLPVLKKIDAVYLIWKSPWMSVSQSTFISDIMLRGGFQNIIRSEKKYPVIPLDKCRNATVIFLSSEPYNFSEDDLSALQNQFKKAIIMRVDGTLFSWYGSRTMKTPEYLLSLRAKIAERQAIFHGA